jgi:NADH-quinone oxidoreductase subunit G
VHGAIDAGLVPGFLPGRVSLDAGREWFGRAWGSRVPRARGLGTRGILTAAVEGKIEVLVILGSDPVADFPDADLARRGIAGVKHMIAVGAFLTGTSRRAAVALPCTLAGEKTGSVTNLEGRVQRVGRKVAPEGTAMDDWRIAGELALRLDCDFDFATVDEITDELARVAPAFAGVDCTLLRQARDGVVLPLRDHADEIVLRTRGLSILADDGSGSSWDPIKVEGEALADVAGLEELAAEPAGEGAEGPAAESAPALTAPATWTWSGDVPDHEVPPRDAYALRLVVGRRLYDNGRMVSEASALARVRRPFPLHVNPHDASALGVEAGAEVRVTSNRGSQVLPVAIDAGVPVGVARIDFSANGEGVSALIDAHAVVTDLRVETLGARPPSGREGRR